MKTQFILCFALLFFGNNSMAQIHYFTISLDGIQANGGAGTGSAGIGSGLGTFNEITGTFSIDGQFSGLTGTSSSAHIHDGVAGMSGGVVYGLTYTMNVTSGTYSGSGTLTSEQAADLLDGGLYVNIHSSTSPGGEIRGQILASPIYEFVVNLDGAQANGGSGTGSMGSGSGTGIYYINTMQLYIQGRFNALTGVANNAHVHLGSAGMNGGVVFGLNFTVAQDGSFDGVGTLDAINQTNLLIDDMYVNIHTQTAPGGEIRGQILLNSCLSLINVDDDPIASNTYSADIVNSTGKVTIGDNVLFIGYDEVNLNPGFAVEVGGQFEAAIGPCFLSLP